MFRGRHILKMEARGRLSIPSRIRELMNVLYEGNLILTCGFFENVPHILVVPLKEWEKFESEYPLGGLIDHDEESFLTRIRTIGSCEEVRVDDHGRIILPEFMREYARLDKELVLVGMGRYLAIFSPRTLGEVNRSAEKHLSKVRGKLAQKTEIPGDSTATDR
jgi:MraZ protein